MKSNRENHIMICPRGTKERGGIVLMPMQKNIPKGHSDWKLTECPECNKPCWRMPGMELVEAQGAAAMCTECGIREGVK